MLGKSSIGEMLLWVASRGPPRRDQFWLLKNKVRLLMRMSSIGRITEGLLLNVAQEVDVVEPIAKFTQALEKKPGVRRVFNMGLEEWQPSEGDQYDLIWIQWCLGHLKDDQLVQFLERCKSVLTPNSGLIVVKENITSGDNEIFDEQDSAVTR